MPLRVKNNTNYAPFKVEDLINRGDTVGAVSLVNDTLTTNINDDFIFYLTQHANYNFITGIETTDILTACIYEYYKDRVILDKYSDAFDGWDEFTDFGAFVDMVKTTIENCITRNAEKYKKLYKAMVVDFNPLWNVDGIETTERILNQTGTNERAKTGDDTTTHTGTVTDSKSGKEATTRTGSESTDIEGTDTETTSRTTFDSSSFYDVEKKETTPTNREDTLTYNNVKDEKTFTDREDVRENDLSDTTEYNSADTETRNLTDTERIVVERHGNIGVTTTTRLLTEFTDYADNPLTHFVDVVARDCVNSFTFMVY